MGTLKCVVVSCLMLTVLSGFFSIVSGTASLELGLSLSQDEGSDFEVCVSLDPPATGNTDVTVTTSVGTATGGLDFSILNEVITFTSGETRRCTTNPITIHTDNIVESVENFVVRISSNDIPIDPLSSFGSTVSINDRSRITIGFTSTEYTTPNEIDSFSDVCATITDGEVDRDVSFDINLVSGGSATQIDDFNLITVISPRFSPDLVNNNPCIQISLENDMLVEEDEYFYVELSGGSEAINVPANLTARVTITDDDGVILDLDQSSISISEGDSGVNTSASLCLTLRNVSDGLRRDVEISLSTQDRAARASDNDYYPFQNQILTIPSTTSVGGQVCTSIVIIGDDVRESDELFQVAISAVNSNDVVPTIFRITITDDGDVNVACPDLSAPLNGQVAVNDINNVEGSTATYTCDDTYILVGNTLRICENTGELDGVWNGSDPVCQLVDCGQPPQSENTNIQSSTTTLGSTAIYSCIAGYELSTGTLTLTRECLSSGSWSGMTPNCTIVDCQSPPETTNGQVSFTTTTFQSTATYTCSVGYQFLSGDEQIARTCEDNGLWSDSTPQCEIVDCGQPPTITNGLVSVSATTFQSDATYTCSEGYQFASGAQEVSIMCQANMMWSGPTPVCEAIDCGLPPDVTNGQVTFSSTTFNSQATYQCNSGYEFSSGVATITRTCQMDESWSGTIPVCELVDCGPPPSVSNAQVDASATIFQSVATYQCDRGFAFTSGDSAVSINCLDEGTWSTPSVTPDCERILCEELSNPRNGTVTQQTERVVDSTATYSCDGSIELVGEVNVTCQPNGTWSAEEPTCLVVCGQLSLDGGVVEQTDGNREGSVATHSCNDGFIFSGDEERTCQSSGAWSGSAASCSLIPSTVALSNAGSDSVVIGASVAAGIAILIIIIVGGVLCLACVIIRKKKVYKKYVLPYRTYMYANSLRNHSEGVVPDNDIRQWENENHTHALAAVEALDN